jgi:ABC-type lipoprotein release transport system permease subunit
VRGDLGKAVQQLKRESGKGLFAGGVKLPLALAELGLIDEYEFVVHPRLAGVLAFAVGQRRREVSIRVALGAQPNQVESLFVRRGILLTSTGSVLGLAAAMGLSRWISSLLFEVTALDPATYAASAIVVSAAALMASYVPARRASSVDPMESLRAD